MESNYGADSILLNYCTFYLDVQLLIYYFNLCNIINSVTANPEVRGHVLPSITGDKSSSYE